MAEKRKANVGPAEPSSRRKFLGRLMTGAIVGAGLGPALFRSNKAEAAEIGPATVGKRRSQAQRVRLKAMLARKKAKFPDHPTTGDEESIPGFVACFSKSLPHNPRGEVDGDAYRALLKAIASGKVDDFEALPMGGGLKLKNPLASYGFGLEGLDAQQFAIPKPPAFSSDWQAFEAAELYWMALCRDVPFIDYLRNTQIAEAALELSSFSDVSEAGISNGFSPATVFRGPTNGDLTGPFVSQFLLKPVPYGTGEILQVYRTAPVGADYMTKYLDWLDIQNGVTFDKLPPRVAPRGGPTGFNTFDPQGRYIRSARDLAEYVHFDFTYQAFLNAALILLRLGNEALSNGNPYKNYRTMQHFTTGGEPHVLDLVARVAQPALKAAWFQKWCVHRHMRPEEYGGRVHNHRVGNATYPLSPRILNASVLDTTFVKYGTYLLPQAYPEGCPPHSAYPSGHATYSGACATVLKAFFDENFIMPSPVVASPDGAFLIPQQVDLTIGGELNKLGGNISLARAMAGIHWRSDGQEGLKLGEAVAIAILQDLKDTNCEPFEFTFTKFDGTKITI
jgi:hypothetical protein